jgi:peptidoglycan hydrolase-like protein with peptidoglycan-binding domain
MNIDSAQRRLVTAGFDPGELDGLYGPNTARALRLFQKEHNLAVTGEMNSRTETALRRYEEVEQGVAEADRVILHWTAGSNSAGKRDRIHYHAIVEGDGEVVTGHESVADNVVTTDGDYAAHTLNLNTRSIGIALAGMHGASERPFDPGKYPLTERQLDSAAQLVADVLRKYGIPLTRETVLTHAEVEPTLGVEQRGKWDITWLPGREDVGDPVEVGDELRRRIESYL